MALNNKQLKAIELLVYSPNMQYQQIANEVGVHRDTFRKWREYDEEFKGALDKAIKERWKAAEAMAVHGMIGLANEGNYNAIKYLLDNLGYKPEEKSKVTVDGAMDIRISIEE